MLKPTWPTVGIEFCANHRHECWCVSVWAPAHFNVDVAWLIVLRGVDAEGVCVLWQKLSRVVCASLCQLLLSQSIY